MGLRVATMMLQTVARVKVILDAQLLLYLRGLLGVPGGCYSVGRYFLWYFRFLLRYPIMLWDYFFVLNLR